MKKSIILCLSILLIAMTGCKKDKNSWGKLEQGAVTVEVGKTVQLNLKSDGNVKPQWVSADETIATVDANGLVTGVRVGTTTVTVNGLECSVTVFDQYDDVIEPCQNWGVTYDEVETYMIKNYGSGVAIIEVEKDTVRDTVIDITIRVDTTFRIDTIRVDTTFRFDTVPVFDTVVVKSDTLITEHPYISYAKFTYDLGIAVNQFVDEYEYEFVYDKVLGTEALIITSMTINAAHVGEIKTFLNNRYVYLDSKGYFYEMLNEWYAPSYIYNNNPTIIYSETELQDK